jgi:hypothetical protein
MRQTGGRIYPSLNITARARSLIVRIARSTRAQCRQGRTDTVAVEVYLRTEEVGFTVTVEILNTMTVRKVCCFKLEHELL